MPNPKVVILCGGKGTRLREETEFKPKPMVTIGGLPILWHIMKIYSHYGFNDFVLCLGYRGETIKQFFLTHELMHNDVTIRLRNRKDDVVHHNGIDEDWTITFAETGLEAMTGSRIKKIEKYVDSDNFFVTYGDGISNVDISRLFEFHRKQNTKGTLVATHPHSKWGMVKEGLDGVVKEFVEKPVLFDYINGGFYCFKKDFFDYLSDEDSCVLETKAFDRLVKERQFSMFKHEGFWHAMDTYKDYLDLNEMWDKKNTPWRVWR